MTPRLKIRLVYGLVLFLGVVVVGVAAIGMRLIAGPFSLPFLVTPVSHAIAGVLPDYRSSLEDVVVVWKDWQQGLDIEVVNLTLTDQKGQLIARLPRFAVGLDAVALVTGHIVPTSIKLTKPALQLLRREDGTLGISTQSTADGGSNIIIQSLLDGFLSDNAEGGISTIKTISIVDATLAIYDIVEGGIWQIVDTELEIVKTAGGVAVNLSGLLVAGELRSSLKLDLEYDRQLDTAVGDIALDGWTPSLFAREFGPLAFLKGIDLPLSAKVHVRLGPGWHVETARFSLTAGSGRLQPPELFNEPVTISTAKVEGTLDRVAGHLEISTLYLGIGGGSFEGRGAVKLDPNGEGYELSLDLSELPFETIGKIWPVTFKPFSRNWLVRNVTGGVIRSGDLKLKLDSSHSGGAPLPDGSLTLNFVFEDLQIHYLRPMPPISRARGRGVLTASSLILDIDDGVIEDKANSLHVDLTGAHALLDGLNKAGRDYADISVTFQAPVSHVVRLIDYPPLGYARKYNIDAEVLNGQAALKGHFRFPLIKKMQLDDVDIDVGGDIKDFYAPIMGGNGAIEHGNIKLSVTKKRLIADGTIVMSGLPFKAHWREKFVRGTGYGSEVKLAGNLSAAQLEAAFGTRLGFTGHIGVDLSIFGSGLNFERGSGVLDLEHVVTSLELLSWNKKDLDPGEATFNFVVKGDSFDITDLSMQAAGLHVKGKAVLSNRFLPQHVAIEQLTIGANEFSFDLAILDHGYRVRLEGEALEFGPVFDSFRSDGDGRDTPNIELDFNLARVLGSNDTDLINVNGMLRYLDSELTALHISADQGNGKGLALSIFEDGVTSTISLHSGNAGHLMKALDLYTGGGGGDLTLSAKSDQTVPDSPTTGRVEITDFKILKAPGLARAMQLGSLGGMRDILAGGQMSFDRFKLAFSLDANELRFKDAVAIGSSMGLRMSGRLYEDLTRVDVKGVIIPAYTINRIIRAVPIVGDVLSGGSADGVLAINFSIDGPVDNLNVVVGSMSAVTPGMMKGLLDDNNQVYSPVPE